MKYLHDKSLSELTTFLTDHPVGMAGTSPRSLHGRLEAYTMKRGSDDKRYASKLGEKFVASLENLEAEIGNIKRATRKRSQSAGVFQEVAIPISKLSRRSRAISFDGARKEEGGLTYVTELDNLSRPTIIPSALGDFAEQGTRRLMTNLILTLNMSFPDFDFAAAQPTDFIGFSVKESIDKINKRFADVALKKETFLTELWTSIDSVMTLSDCDVYSYHPVVSDEGDALAFLSQTLVSSTTEDPTGGDIEETRLHSITTMWSFNFFFVNKVAKRILLFTCVESMKYQKGEERTEDDEYAFLGSDMVEDCEVNFDMDPEASLAGGIPISTV